MEVKVEESLRKELLHRFQGVGATIKIKQTNPLKNIVKNVILK